MTPNRIFFGLIGFACAVGACLYLAGVIGRVTDSILVVVALGSVIVILGYLVLRPHAERVAAEGYWGPVAEESEDDGGEPVKHSPFVGDVLLLFVAVVLIFLSGLGRPVEADYPLALIGGALIGWPIGGLIHGMLSRHADNVP